MPSNASTRSSSGGSRRRRCCRRPTPRRCCFGLCSPLARSTCERSTAGRQSRRRSSTGQLTWPPEPIPSTHRRPRHAKFQHDPLRHLRKLTAAVSAMLLAAVAGTSAMAEDVTLTVSRWSGQSADAQAELMKQFTEETGIKVNLDAVDWSQLKQKQVLSLSGETGQYDLVMVHDTWFNEYVKSGYLHPVDAFVTDEKLTGPDFDIADFAKGMIDGATADGKFYGVPTNPAVPIFVYNKEMLDAEGHRPAEELVGAHRGRQALQREGDGHRASRAAGRRAGGAVGGDHALARRRLLHRRRQAQHRQPRGDPGRPDVEGPQPVRRPRQQQLALGRHQQADPARRLADGGRPFRHRSRPRESGKQPRRRQARILRGSCAGRQAALRRDELLLLVRCGEQPEPRGGLSVVGLADEQGAAHPPQPRDHVGDHRPRLDRQEPGYRRQAALPRRRRRSARRTRAPCRAIQTPRRSTTDSALRCRRSW